MNPLSKRLNTALLLLPKCEVIADIGCDHGQLSAALILSGKCKRVIAADISAGSLQKARVRAERLELSSQIDTRIGDGMAVLVPLEVQAALIAGMGGMVIAGILERGEEVARGLNAIVMQCMSDAVTLRKFLRENGYVIDDEVLIKERGRIYPTIRARSGESVPGGYPEDLLGAINLKKRDPLAEQLGQRYLKALDDALMQLEQNGNQQARMDEIQMMRRQIREAITWR